WNDSPLPLCVEEGRLIGHFTSSIAGVYTMPGQTRGVNQVTWRDESLDHPLPRRVIEDEPCILDVKSEDEMRGAALESRASDAHQEIKLPDYLQDLMKRSTGGLQEHQKEAVKRLLYSYQDVFAASD
ncbi:unnamed protein product, partial [Owenia fusiformis]